MTSVNCRQKAAWAAIFLVLPWIGCEGRDQQDPMVSGSLRAQDPSMQAGSTRSNTSLEPASADDTGTSTAATPDISDALETVFTHGVCVCEDMTDIGNALMTQSLLAAIGLESTTHSGSVGVNGNVGSIGNLDIDGDFDVGGPLSNVGLLRVAGNLTVGKDMTNAGSGEIQGDASIGGNLLLAGFFTVKDWLKVTGAISNLSFLSYQTMDQAPVALPKPPCPCGEGELIDVAGIVAAHRNDPRVDLGGLALSDITLTTGDYYVGSGAFFTGISTIRINGAVRLFVDDNIVMFGHRVIELSEGAKLDMYVSGSILQVGNFLFGSPTDVPPGAIRIFIGSEGEVNMDVICSPLLYIPGTIYAPKASVRFINANMVIKGSLFVRRVMGFGSLTVIP